MSPNYSIDGVAGSTPQTGVPANDLSSVPSTFGELIDQLTHLVLQAFDREVIEKQLRHHTREHLEAVQRRGRQIFRVIRPCLRPAEESDRLARLLDLCAMAHDLAQVFKPQSDPRGGRQREPGVSETVTLERLSELVQTLNGRITDPSVQLTKADMRIVREAILATVCAFDPAEQAIYQPALSHPERPASTVASILALADIGSLGMEGIESYNREGSLLFLEENPDVRGLLERGELSGLGATDPGLGENIRRRLLKRTRFQISFAKSRLKRFPQELRGLPAEAMGPLTQEVFPHLTPSAIQTLEATTPIADDVPLEALLTFFRFDQGFRIS